MSPQKKTLPKVTLLSTEPVWGRCFFGDVDLCVFSRSEKREIHNLYIEVVNFDLFSYPGTFYAKVEFVRITQLLIDFCKKIYYAPCGNDYRTEKRNFLAALFCCEFICNNVFLNDMEKLYQTYMKKLREFMNRVDEKCCQMLSEMTVDLEERISMAKSSLVGPVAPYSQQWLEIVKCEQI